ncbi:hypothetical protein N2152v2_003197 [Parachlorella kessleri]
MKAASRVAIAGPSRGAPTFTPSSTSSHQQRTNLQLTTSATWQVPHTPSTPRRGSCLAALPALAAVPLPKPEPSGPGLAPFLEDDEPSKTSEVALAPPLAVAISHISVLGVLIALSPVSLSVAGTQEYDAADLRNQGWTWFTLPCPSNPYRTRRDEQAVYVVPTFWLRLTAHLEDRPLHGLYQFGLMHGTARCFKG